jgi:hypothetical protein
MSFLSAGRKYHDIMVRAKSNSGGKTLPMEWPVAICEMAAPDMQKKKPA